MFLNKKDYTKNFNKKKKMKFPKLYLSLILCKIPVYVKKVKLVRSSLLKLYSITGILYRFRQI